MVHYSENEMSRLMDFPLDGVLAAFGKRTDHKGYMYYSPFREESEPSFHIDSRTNRWYDFGTAEGGGLIELVCRLKGCDRSEALQVIADMDGTFVHIETIQRQNLPKTSHGTTSSVIHIENVDGCISRYALLDYALNDRKIPIDILEKYCSQITYRIGDGHDSLYYAIGFPNNSGGWVLRSPKTKICTSSDISTLDRRGRISSVPSSREALVFEGFFDMLSWRVIYGSKSLDCDVCVLNSVSNWKRAAQWLSSHGKICLCLDNDDAGRKAVTDIAESVRKMNGDLKVWDMSTSYENYKDVGEMLEAQGASRSRARSIR